MLQGRYLDCGRLASARSLKTVFMNPCVRTGAPSRPRRRAGEGTRESSHDAARADCRAASGSLRAPWKGADSLWVLNPPLTVAERLFRNRPGEPLARHGVRCLLRWLAAVACSEEETLTTKHIHPHAMRHSAATYLSRSGVDIVTTRPWLGPDSIEATNRHLALDLEASCEAIER